MSTTGSGWIDWSASILWNMMERGRCVGADLEPVGRKSRTWSPFYKNHLSWGPVSEETLRRILMDWRFLGYEYWEMMFQSLCVCPFTGSGSTAFITFLEGDPSASKCREALSYPISSPEQGMCSYWTSPWFSCAQHHCWGGVSSSTCGALSRC